MVEIIVEAHSTTTDNENHIASGFHDAKLSELGVRQSHDLGERRKNEHFDAIYCSDLQRAYETAELAFGSRFPIIRDARLRECDYGDMTQHPSDEVGQDKIYRIDTPFSNGESYNQVLARMKDFLQDLLDTRDGQRVLIIAHAGTRYGIDRWVVGKDINEILTADLRWKWQPGWTYRLESLAK